MRHFFIILSIVCISTSLSFAGKYKLVYHEGTLKTAKNLAETENKLLLVKFYADWCVPCKWMDETTFSDPDIVNKINNNFVALKVNIDDFDGFSLRQELAVSVLPTLIIYDSKGNMVKRIEETLPTSRMAVTLDNTIRNNGNKIVHKINQSPTKIVKAPAKTPFIDNQAKSFKLQLGVFKGFENTMNFLEDIKEKVDDQALVLHDYKDGNTMYKVLIGNYKTVTEAESARSKLKSNHGLDSVIF